MELFSLLSHLSKANFLTIVSSVKYAHLDRLLSTFVVGAIVTWNPHNDGLLQISSHANF
jgi:hypothetical protein